MAVDVKKLRRRAEEIPSLATIDGRMKESIEIKKVKAKLDDDPRQTAIDLLKDIISRDTVIEKCIFSAVLNSGNSFVNKDGKINKLLETLLLRYQKEAKTALIELLRVTGQDKPAPGTSNGNNDLAGLFDDDEEKNES